MCSTPEALCGQIGIVPRSQPSVYIRDQRVKKAAAHLHEPVRRAHTQRTRRCPFDRLQTRIPKFGTGQCILKKYYILVIVR